jgi:hypothetical protein
MRAFAAMTLHLFHTGENHQYKQNEPVSAENFTLNIEQLSQEEDDLMMAKVNIGQ